MDVLSDVLQTMRLRGTAYFHAVFRAPWGMDINGGSVANFHLVTEGRCWVRVPQVGTEFWLNEGDVVVFPHGHSHALGADRSSRTVPAEKLLEGAGSGRSQPPPIFGGEGVCTRLVCGHFERTSTSRHPLLASLPPVMHVQRHKEGGDPWRPVALELAEPVPRNGVGSSAIADRLAEILLIHVLNAWVRQEDLDDGFLGALHDPALCRVLEAIHSRPAHTWTVGDLARHGGVSRSTLATRFRDTLGVPPIRYVTSWRLECAHAELSATGDSVARVARSAGYTDEFSFSRAFKREFGVTPAALRRSVAAS